MAQANASTSLAVSFREPLTPCQAELIPIVITFLIFYTPVFSSFPRTLSLVLADRLYPQTVPHLLSRHPSVDPSPTLYLPATCYVPFAFVHLVEYPPCSMVRLWFQHGRT